MTLQEYKKRVLDTKIYPQETDNFGRAYVTFGAIGESFELADALISFLESTNQISDKDVIKELGDVWWYAATGCYEYGIKLEYKATKSTDDLNALMDLFLANTINLAEPCKKFYRDGVNKVEPFGMYLESLYNLTGSLCELLNTNIETIWKINVYKLHKRRLTNNLHGND